MKKKHTKQDEICDLREDVIRFLGTDQPPEELARIQQNLIGLFGKEEAMEFMQGATDEFMKREFRAILDGAAEDAQKKMASTDQREIKDGIILFLRFGDHSEEEVREMCDNLAKRLGDKIAMQLLREAVWESRKESP